MIRFVPILVLALAAVLRVEQSYACDCSPPDSPRVALESSAAVFIGRVVELQLDSMRYLYRATFQVSGYWKGGTAPTITILTQSQESACGYAFTYDSAYLVYAFLWYDSLYTGICSRTVILSQAAYDLSELGSPTPVDVYEASQYFPLHLGDEWSFGRDSSSHTERITDTATAHGHLYYGLTIWGVAPSYWFRSSGDSVFVMESLTDTAEALLYRFNANIGDTLILPAQYACSFGTGIVLLGKADTVSTPAGTFICCLHFRHVASCFDAGIRETWIARGVGRVKYSEDNFAGLFTYNLTSYELITTFDPPRTGRFTGGCSLSGNYPNPFNAETDIRYRISEFGFVTVKVYDLLGREVAALVRDRMQPGEYSVRWNAGKLPSGVYFSRLQTGDFSQTRKLVLLK